MAGLANANGTLIEAYGYDAYGKVRGYTAQAAPCDQLGDVDGAERSDAEPPATGKARRTRASGRRGCLERVSTMRASGRCDVDLADFEVLSICYYNSGVPADCPIAAIAKLDFNYDAEINDLDLQAFAARFTGPHFGLFADGDWNSNGSVGPVDHNAFVHVCYSGPGGGFNTNGCQVFDFDGDDDVDLDDYGVLLALWYETSPNAAMTLTAADASAVNDYYFTGRSLDSVPHGGERHQRYYCRARTYNTERFMQRDSLGLAPSVGSPTVASSRARPTNVPRRPLVASYKRESLVLDTAIRNLCIRYGAAAARAHVTQYSDGASLTSYVRSQPTNAMDPSGLGSTFAFFAAGRVA